MKSIRSRFILLAFLSITALLLSACQIDCVTAINKDGSGSFTEEVGFTQAELTNTGISAGNDICNQLSVNSLPNETVEQQTRNDNETWCIYKTSFNTLQELRSYYNNSDISSSNITLDNNHLIYDVTLNLVNTYGFSHSGTMVWEVSMPGQVTHTNADKRDGNTLYWNLAVGKTTRIYAESDTTNKKSALKTILSALATVAGVCLSCLLVILVIVLIVVLIVRKNKKKKAEPVILTPEGTPLP